ncbi:MAG: PQQ-binding-like beta-propeller repeat protein [Acidobacteriia bacterium]|nr:PQQ-binding-like beta-propeller repeat protein [Methyloceanibacter sp.]MCL6492914.1 PQQ-binding-like beta-propeller repeat protein [Terriglobia bacterium]
MDHLLTTRAWLLSGIAAFSLLGAAARAGELDANALLHADENPNNWVMYHQSYKSWHYSALDQINTNNVKDLKLLWIHTPDPGHRGVQSFPLVIDGTLYYTTSDSIIWALDAATGAFKWKFKPKIDTDRANATIYNPYNRGLAAGYGKLYVGTVDGRVIAIDMLTGKTVWDKQVLTVEKGNKGFTGAPLVVKDKVIIGANGGELSGCCGPIIALDAATGGIAWEFDTVGGDERSRASWGNDSWKVGGGGGWMTGTYDPTTDTVYWGTANPAPDYDWSGPNWMKEGPRPGLNLYTSGVVALDPNTGRLKSYFQENPHDMWDFDGAVGEFVLLEREGKHYIVHPNKGGYVYVYLDEPGFMPLRLRNVWHLGKTANFVQGINPETGELIGRRFLHEGMNKALCPAIDGAISWNSGSYNPVTGLYYKVGQEWCQDIEVQKVDRPKDYSGQNYFGATWNSIPPPGYESAFGHVSGRDPITGHVAWEVVYRYPPLASLLSTKGGLVFVPGADGMFDALDAKTGEKLWSHNDGLGHHGGVISYAVNGKQYIAVVTGWGSHVSGNYGPLFGEPFLSMPTDNGQLLVFGL